MKQLDLEEAIAAAAGMTQALDHAEREEPLWGEQAYSFLVRFALANPAFISEDVSDASKKTDFPQPPTDRAWGGIYKRALKEGLIAKDGTGKSRRRHASICPRWRSLVYVAHETSAQYGLHGTNRDPGGA